MRGETKGCISDIVSIDPGAMHGAPCLHGTQVPVRLLLDGLKSGFTIDDSLAGRPRVTREQVEELWEPTRDLAAEF